MSGPEIKTIELKSGKKRYRFTVDIGADPKTGKRKQKTMTFDKLKDAKTELARILNQVNEGTYVKPSDITVNEILDNYLKGATRGRRANTKRSYSDAFRCVRERLGERKAQQVTKAEIEDLVDFMLTEGRKRGGRPGTGLSGRSVNLTLGRLRAALQGATDEGILVRNVASLVKNVPYQQPERATWTKAEVRKFLKKISGDRHEVAWRLSLYGLRRGEVLGLRLDEDFDFDKGTLKVNQERILCDYEVLLEAPKSRNGLRELPLDDDLMNALRRLRKQRMQERAEAGNSYAAGLADVGWYQGGDYLVADEVGMPVHPEWYSDEFGRILRAAGLKRIALHDSRHTTLSLMEKAGVPISVISKWAGHYDSAFTQKTYVHAESEDMETGRKALARIHRIA